jgi:ABC-type bacteriocin/lantibiotic exporter with double-glycine peptidase domain
MVKRAPRVLAVPRIRQRNDHECGPTALAAIAQFHGVQVTPAELAALAGTTGAGTDHANLIAAAQAIGATVTAKADASLDELVDTIAAGAPAIVGWWSGDPAHDPTWSLAERIARDLGHYSVVCGVTAGSLCFMDPDDGSYREMTDEDFLRVWYDTDSATYDRVDRWLLIPRW